MAAEGQMDVSPPSVEMSSIAEGSAPAATTAPAESAEAMATEETEVPDNNEIARSSSSTCTQDPGTHLGRPSSWKPLETG